MDSMVDLAQNKTYRHQPADRRLVSQFLIKSSPIRCLAKANQPQQWWRILSLRFEAEKGGPGLEVPLP